MTEGSEEDEVEVPQVNRTKRKAASQEPWRL